MTYLVRVERDEIASRAMVLLGAHPHFQQLCEAWISDLIDKHNDILTLDGTALQQAIGAAKELKRILESVYGARAVAERFAMMTAGNEMQGKEPYLSQSPIRESGQA